MKNKNFRKTFIIDTSVLLYDKCAIHSFPNNDTIIPIVVLEELDRFKDKKGVVGENARYVNRYLDDLRTKGNLHSGIKIQSLQPRELFYRFEHHQWIHENNGLLPENFHQ